MAAAQSAKVVHRTCPLCEAHCGIAVELDDAGQNVVGVRGDEQDPLSKGYICPKAYGLKGLQEDPDRLQRPLRRTKSGFEEIDWEDALDLAASKLGEIKAQHGADAIGTYLGNPSAHDLGTLLYMQPFFQVLGTRWRFSATSVDQLPKMLSSALLFGGVLTIPIPDVDHTDYLLVLGANPEVSNGSLMTAPDMPGRLRRLRERGGQVVVVDPRRSETAKHASRHLFIRPGTDALFLFALVHTLFAEERVQLGALEGRVEGLESVRRLAEDFAPEAVAGATGIEAEAIRRVARELAEAPSAAVYGRIGTCTQEFGTLASWLVDVLNVLTGNLDRPGGALFPNPAASTDALRPKTPGYLPFARWHSRVRGLPEFNGELPVATLAEEIEGGAEGDERVRALVVISGNPVLSTPNGARLERALASLDFMVSVDIYRNETSRFADLILPPVSQLERANYDLVFHGLAVRNTSKLSPVVLEPPAGAKQQWEILLELTARLAGLPAAGVDEMVFKTVLGACLAGQSEVDEESARKRQAEDGVPGGPERILDVLLRTGPYGDGFDPASDGVSWSALGNNPHGIDHGALAPQLGEDAILNTQSGKIELAPQLLVDDVARLAAAKQGEAAELVLIGRRQVRNNNSWMHNVHSLAKGRDRCTLLVHPSDAAARGLRDGQPARLRSRVGEIEVPVKLSDEMMPGVVSLPHGFGHSAPDTQQQVAASQPGANSNTLCDESFLDALSGNAVLNGIPVELRSAADA